MNEQIQKDIDLVRLRMVDRVSNSTGYDDYGLVLHILEREQARETDTAKIMEQLNQYLRELPMMMAALNSAAEATQSDNDVKVAELRFECDRLVTERDKLLTRCLELVSDNTEIWARYETLLNRCSELEHAVAALTKQTQNENTAWLQLNGQLTSAKKDYEALVVESINLKDAVARLTGQRDDMGHSLREALATITGELEK